MDVAETAVVEYAHKVFAQLFPGCRLDVTIYGGKRADCIAAMSRTGNTGHLALVRGDWFEDQLDVLDTIIHEFAHFAADGHGHSIRWGESCCRHRRPHRTARACCRHEHRRCGTSINVRCRLTDHEHDHHHTAARLVEGCVIVR